MAFFPSPSSSLFGFPPVSFISLRWWLNNNTAVEIDVSFRVFGRLPSGKVALRGLYFPGVQKNRPYLNAGLTSLWSLAGVSIETIMAGTGLEFNGDINLANSVELATYWVPLETGAPPQFGIMWGSHFSP